MTKILIILLSAISVVTFGQSKKPSKINCVDLRFDLNSDSTFNIESKTICTVNRDVDNFDDIIIFSHAFNFLLDTFIQTPDFSKNIFHTFVLNDSKIDSGADFSKSSFRRLNFRNDIINGVLNFTSSPGIDTATIEDCILNGTIDFSDSNISNKRQYLTLTNLKFETGSQLIFDGSILPDTINFSFNSTISKLVDFTKANLHFDSKLDVIKLHYINLENTDISKIKIDYIHFRLFFTPEKATNESLDELKESIYKQLLKNFDANNQIPSYKILDIEYHYFLFDRLKLHWIGIFYYHWWEFGYAKEKIFKWIFRFVFFFTILNLFLINFLNRYVYKMDNIPTVKGINYFTNLHNRQIVLRTLKIHNLRSTGLIYSKHFLNRFWYTFAYTSSIFFKITLKIEKIQFKNWLGCLYLMMIYLSGLLSVAYLANYVLNK